MPLYYGTVCFRSFFMCVRKNARTSSRPYARKRTKNWKLKPNNCWTRSIWSTLWRKYSTHKTQKILKQTNKTNKHNNYPNNTNKNKPT